MNKFNLLELVFIFTSFKVINYLANLYCVCVIWNTLDANQFVAINFDWIRMEENYPQMIWLKYETIQGNRKKVDDLVRLGIDSGCQVKENTK